MVSHPHWQCGNRLREHRLVSLHYAEQASTLNETDNELQEILPRVCVSDHGNAYCRLLVLPRGVLRAFATRFIPGLMKIQTKGYSLEQVTKAFGDTIIEDLEGSNGALKARDLESKEPVDAHHEFVSA